MRIQFLILTILFAVAHSGAHEENEFAEFEDDFSELGTEAPVKADEAETTPQPMKRAQVDEKVVEFEEDDFGVDGADEVIENEQNEKHSDEPPPPAPLRFTDVPSHFRSNWASYQVESLAVLVILLYLLNYLIGKQSNSTIAYQIFDHCKPILEEQFALVADDGITELEKVEPELRRDTDYNFSAWCSGRINVNSLYLQMKMVKRQDLISRVMDFFDPQSDKMTIKVNLENANDVDPIVLCIGEKKTVTKNVKDSLDLATFAAERKQTASQFNLPANFSLYSDQNEVIYSILDPGVVTLLRKYESAIEFIHISDQYTGPKPQEGETFTRLPEAARILNVVLNASQCNDQETMEDILNLVFYLIDKVRKFKLSKDAKVKAEKRRKEFEEAFMRNTHQFRQEAAQARREEKTRERKQKLLDETDPERQRRLEAKELKREAKAKQPKMKQMKVK